MSKQRLFNLIALLSTFICYLEWGGNNSGFLLQMELSIFLKAGSKADALSHPFVLLPLIGQLTLFATVFQKQPGRFLTYAGIILLGVLILFIFIIGLMSLNIKTTLSTVPFIASSVYCIVLLRKKKK